MGAKRIQVSVDAGTTWRTLPGNTGELRQELASFDDTVFGQNWQSEDVSIQRWMLTSNSLFKGLAGYVATLKQTGTSTAMTAEPCTLVSGKTYQITSSVKRMINYSAALTVLDAAVDRTVEVLSIDYINGTVTFKPTYTVTGAVTITGAYLPLATLAKGRSFTLTQTAAEIETTDYETAAANGGYATFLQGLKTVGLEIQGVYDSSNAFSTAMNTRAMVVVEISSPGNGSTVFRGIFKRKNFAQQGQVGALEEQTLSFGLFVPDGALLETPFSWYYTVGSTLNQGIRDILSMWIAGTSLKVRYLPEGVTGTQGDAIVTECTISNALEGQNEFKFSFRGTGATTSV